MLHVHEEEIVRRFTENDRVFIPCEILTFVLDPGFEVQVRVGGKELLVKESEFSLPSRPLLVRGVVQSADNGYLRVRIQCSDNPELVWVPTNIVWSGPENETG